MIRMGIIGYGYWGPNLVRNFTECPGSQVVAVSDQRPERLAIVKKRYPAVEVTSDYQELLGNPQIDAVAIATPVSTHHALTIAALKAGKHVLVEKPMAASTEQAIEMRDEANSRGLVLLVDHTFVYTGAVRKIHDLIASGELGEIYYYDSVRVNLGLFQHDIDVFWDLAVHDLSIMDYLIPFKPHAVSATGCSHIPGKPENIGYLTLFYEKSMISHIHVNWMSPVKLRKTLIGGSRKMILYDDVEPSEKVKVYDKGVTLQSDPDSLYQMMISYRTGDVWVPQLDITEALKIEAQHFADCIEKGERPCTGADAGLRVVEILEAATHSMRNRGNVCELKQKEQVR